MGRAGREPRLASGGVIGERLPGQAPARKLDVAAILAAPVEPIPYIVDRFAAAGYVTLLSAHGGEGKSLLSTALAIGVACGSSPGGIDCEKGRALIIDGENGERLISSRYKLADGPPEGVAVYEATGLDLAHHGDWLVRTISDENAQLVVIDSLRTLAPHMAENDGDTVLPVASTLRLVARQTQTAIVVLHHRPKHGPGYRGSSVLRDQVDALFVLGRDPNDPERRTRRYLHCDPSRDGKMRFDLEPDERWLKIDLSGGLLTIDQAQPYGGSERGPTRTETTAERILDIVAGEPLSRSEIARRLDLDQTDRTVGRALTSLVDSEQLERHQDKTYTATSAPANHDAKAPNGQVGGLARPLKAPNRQPANRTGR